MDIVAEKGTVLGAGMLLIAAGAERVGAGEYLAGISLIVTGILLIFLREHLKLHRWGHARTYWRDKRAE